MIARPSKAVLQFAFLVSFWGTTWIIITMQLGVVNPSWSVTYRFLIGFSTLLLWSLWKGLPLRIPRRGYAFVALVGIGQFMLNFNFVYRAESMIPSGLVAVAYALLVPANALLAYIFLKRKASGRLILGSVLGIAGTALMFLHEARGAMNGTTLLGIGLTLCGVLSASTVNVMQASRMGQKLPPFGILVWGMAVGVITNAIFAWVVAGPPQWDARPQYILALLMLGVVASAVAFALYFDLIRNIGPAEAAWTSVLIPVVAMAISTVFEGYRWSIESILGAILAFCGMVIALSRPKSAAR